MPIPFNPSDLPPNSNMCTPFPMPTMSGLHVGAPIAAQIAQPSIQCTPNNIQYQATPPLASPIAVTAPPKPTPTHRAGPPRVTPKKLDRPPLDWRVSGPFPQTLFLGCSVVDFNISLGWGSTEGSTLTVTLVRDPMPTFSVSGASIADRSSRYMGMDFAALKSAAEGVRDTANHYYDTMKPPRAKVEALQAALAALPPNYTEAQYRAVLDNPAYSWSAPAAFTDINGGPIIPGKLYYEFNTTTKKYEQKYWLGPDPGFIADKDIYYNKDGSIGYYNSFEYEGKKGWGINIIGAPVKFHLDEFQFCGVVTDWRKTLNSGGTQYTVTIQTPTHLLNNSQLILGHYAGSVFTKNTNLPVIAPADRAEFDDSIALTTWETAYKALYPSAFVSFTRTYKNYISGPVNITDTYVGDQASETNFFTQSWKGNIKNDGNLPNVINLYGYLESLGPGYFGGARQNDMGVKYNLLIGTLSAMLATHSPGPFNPFGALVGMCAEPPFKKPLVPTQPNTPPQDHDWTDVFSINDCPQVTDSVSVPNPNTAAANVSDSNTTALQNNAATYNTTTYGTAKKIFDFGLIAPTFSTTSSTYKQLYYLDLTELPVLPDLLRYDTNSNPIASISEFIDDVCRKGGCEYFWEMLNLTTEQLGIPITTTAATSVNVLKIRTVSRKTQPPETAVEDYLRGFVGSKTHVEYGKEFNSDAKTRVMYLGGKQKRLVQVKNFRLGKSQTAHIYSPITKRFVILDTKEKNKIRIPNVGSTRHPLNLVRGAENTNLNEVSVNFFADDENWRTTWYQGAPQQSQKETDDENPGVQRAAPDNRGQLVLKTARARAGQTPVVESDWTFIGNYLLSTNLAFNKYKDIITYKTKVNTAEQSTPTKIDYKYVLQKRINNVYTDVTSFVPSPCQLGATAVKSWFKMRTINYTWKATAPKPTPTKVYAKTDTENIGVDYAKNKKNITTQITTLNRFFPLMHDVICPYFGSYKYLPLDGFGNVYNNAGYINTPRPVWYDMWTNQTIIVFNVADLPRTRITLQGTYGNSFIITESELRAALRGFENWRAYLGAKLFKPDIVHMFKNALCPLSSFVIPPVDDPANQANNSGQAVPNRQNDPVNAGQAANVQNQGESGSSVPATTYIFDMDSLNECDYCQIFMGMFYLAKINLANGSALHSTAPINQRAGLGKAVFDDLKIIHSFYEYIAQTYYGKQFMVKMPMVRTYVDKNVYIVDEGYSQSLGYGANNAMRIMEGDGKIYCNYKIHPGGAWEEAGNMIDDQIVIGGWYSNIFQNDQGLIEPILGYWSSLGFDYESYFMCKLLTDQQGKAVDPEKTKGSLFKLGDMVSPPRVCLNNVVGTSTNRTGDGSSTTFVDPKIQPLNHGTDVGEVKT